MRSEKTGDIIEQIERDDGIAVLGDDQVRPKTRSRLFLDRYLHHRTIAFGLRRSKVRVWQDRATFIVLNPIGVLVLLDLFIVGDYLIYRFIMWFAGAFLPFQNITSDILCTSIRLRKIIKFSKFGKTFN